MEITAFRTFRCLASTTPVWRCPAPDQEHLGAADIPGFHAMVIIGCAARSADCLEEHLIVQNSFGMWCRSVSLLRVIHNINLCIALIFVGCLLPADT